MIRVVIADDQALVRGGFPLILETQPDIEVVGEAADGRDAIACVQVQHPDVILMDIRMPGMDGLEATRELMATPNPPRVLIHLRLDEYVYDALRAGASGFLLKDVRPEQLADAVRAVATGDTLLAPVITRRLVEQYLRRPPPCSRTPPALDTLTDRELDVLHLVARGKSNQQIANTLFLGESTVKTHLTHLFAKLGLRDRAQAVVLAYESGLIQAGDE